MAVFLPNMKTTKNQPIVGKYTLCIICLYYIYIYASSTDLIWDIFFTINIFQVHLSCLLLGVQCIHAIHAGESKHLHCLDLGNNKVATKYPLTWWLIVTPQKSNMSIPLIPIFKGSYLFQGPSFWVSMLVFGRVVTKISKLGYIPTQGTEPTNLQGLSIVIT